MCITLTVVLGLLSDTPCFCVWEAVFSILSWICHGWNSLFTFILTNFIKAPELRESIRSASYLTTQQRPLSLLQMNSLGFFQLIPLPTTFPLGGYPLVSSQAVSHQYLSTGKVFLNIFQLSPTQCLYHEWVCPGIFQLSLPPSVFQLEGGK